MSNYALYRLPYADTYTEVRQTRGVPLCLNSLTDLNGQSGFVIAPFNNTDDCPILLLKPDVVEAYRIEYVNVQNNVLFDANDDADRAQYATDFGKFHTKLDTSEFSKIVLSRCVHIGNAGDITPKQLFLRACNLYPRVFIALVSTETSGTWLIATPEILLDGDVDKWRSIALAGTMRYAETAQWTDKNRQEQRYVAHYIRESLTPFVDNLTETEAYTARAGNLLHLRSDFDFNIKDTSKLGDLISTLHPTPAVCGLPKDETYRFILANEARPRKYYSGFTGVLSPNGDTHLYVSLRCTEITANGYDLYAGGGLLKDSEMQQEWDETEAKMETMKRVINLS